MERRYFFKTLLGAAAFAALPKQLEATLNEATTERVAKQAASLAAGGKGKALWIIDKGKVIAQSDEVTLSVDRQLAEVTEYDETTYEAWREYVQVMPCTWKVEFVCNTAKFDNLLKLMEASTLVTVITAVNNIRVTGKGYFSSLIPNYIAGEPVSVEVTLEGHGQPITEYI